MTHHEEKSFSMASERPKWENMVDSLLPPEEEDEERHGYRLKPRVVTPTSKEGIKFDEGKCRIELFPGDVLFAISDILSSGAEKYAERNWELGMAYSRVFGAMMRHAWAWWQGRGPTNKSFLFGDLDPETQRSHLWHMGACAVFLIAYEMRGVGEDDRPTAGERP